MVAGFLYPETLSWPENVKRIEHLPPSLHRDFYNSQRFTLNITRADMIAMSHSPSVRLFEAAACGTPIISDWWENIDEIFLPDEEILISHSPEETLHYLRETAPVDVRALVNRAREKVLQKHTASLRAIELETHLREALDRSRSITREAAGQS